MTTTAELNKLMNRIQSLLSLADQPGIAPEAANGFRQRAESLMRQYRQDEENLIASDQPEIAPGVHRLWLGPADDQTRANSGGHASATGESFYREWYALAYAAARHAGAEICSRWGRNPETGEYGIFAIMVGYSGDLRLAEMIYSNARIVFGERLEPKPDASLSDQVNAYRLRSAGITRDRAATLIWGETSHARAAMVGKLYKAECAARGEAPALDGRGVNAALYRDEFAKAFASELEYRLRRARDAADSVGGRMVLAGRAERVKEAFYQEFPDYRPQPKTEVAVVETAVAEVAKPKGRAKKPYWETAAYQRDLARRYGGVGRAATRAGKNAAAEVALDRVPPAQRLAQEAPESANGREAIGE